MKKYRTHTCGELNKSHKEKEISLAGWINKKRDHGNLLFIDLRDNFGITQCVIDKSNEIFMKIEKRKFFEKLKTQTFAKNSHRTDRSMIFLKSTKIVLSYREVTFTCPVIMRVIPRDCLDSKHHFLYA